MRPYTFILVLLSCLMAVPAAAFPPAPYYRIYGTVRNEQGRPLAAGEGTVILDGVYSGLGHATVSGDGVSEVAILNGGGGYTSPPVVHFVGANGSGSGASGVATLTDGVVTGVTVTNPGSGYTAPVTVGFSGGGGAPIEIVRTITSPAEGTNYALPVPMESAAIPALTDLSAMRPFFPFTIRVVIGGVNHVPIQIEAAPSQFWKERIDSVNSPGINTEGNNWAVGLPADKLRLDLTLGVDRDGDGLPDSWEQVIIGALGLGSLDDVTPDGDSDRDGVSNWREYVAGTYAFDGSSKFEFKIIDILTTEDAGVVKTTAHLQFLAITGRTYRILEWTGDGPPARREFTLAPAATKRYSSLLATEVTEQSVYVAPRGDKSRFFVVSVE